jgi:hypothetical protein
MENEMRYFEVDIVSTTDINAGTYSICIRGIREPSKKEAKEFLEKDMESLGYDTVSFVNETTLEEAKNFYDMENEDKFPIFQ